MITQEGYAGFLPTLNNKAKLKMLRIICVCVCVCVQEFNNFCVVY